MKTKAQQIAKAFCENYLKKFNKDLITLLPTYSKEWFYSLCDKIGADRASIEKEMGTLGSGNHFIEINIDQGFSVQKSVNIIRRRQLISSTGICTMRI